MPSEDEAAHVGARISRSNTQLIEENGLEVRGDRRAAGRTTRLVNLGYALAERIVKENEKLQAMLDKAEILEVLTIAINCRDSGDWDRLVQCFHPDARVTTSWFDGTAREFAAQSKRMMDGHHPSDTQRHVMNNPVVTLKGNRAVCEFYLLLHQGRTLDGYEFDFQTWSVALNLFEKTNGEWRIMRRMNVYEKERMDPHIPGSVPQSYYDGLDLSRYPAPVRFHCYRNERSSGQTPKNLILKGSPEEKAARKAAEDWLA